MTSLLSKLAVVIAAVGGLSVAEAGVIYRWYDLESNPQVGPIDAFIEIDHAYWTLGGSLVGSSDNNAGGTPYYAYFGMERMFLISETTFSALDLVAIRCSEEKDFQRPDGTDGCEDAGIGSNGLLFGDVEGGFDFNLHFGLYLTGSIDADGLSAGVAMASVSNIWTISRFASFDNDNCHSAENACSGGTGYWMLDLNTVPEPGTLALLGVGLAGMGLARRRRKA